METGGNLQMSGELVVKMRSYFSSYHLWAARHFMQLTKEFEDLHVGRSVFNIRHRTYVTSAILSCVAFLEAAVNEMFQDIVDDHPSYIGPIDINSRNSIKAIWNITESQNKSSLSILEKYQLALSLTGREQFNKGHSPYQDVDLAIKLRNALMHYKPMTLGGADIHRLEKLLRNKFALNKLMESSGNPFFPDKCLGYGCAYWAIESSQTFANDFFLKMGIAPNYQKVVFTD